MTLTAGDLKALKELTEVTLEEKLDVVLEKKLSHLPTKDEFFTKMDEMMSELKVIREEKIHPDGKHAMT